MSVYKIFPAKDNFIQKFQPHNNNGRDEILELSNNGGPSRILIEFPQDEINNIINNISGSYDVNLRLFLAHAHSLQDIYNINVFPISQPWSMGTGRSGDTPNPQNGSCWNYPDINNPSTPWDVWDILGNSYKLTQQFSYQDSKDIDININPIVDGWISGVFDNNGLLIKYPRLLESSSLTPYLSFFSIDTHTIYPPHLEIKWDDSYYSSSLPLINEDLGFSVKLINNKNEFNNDSNYIFRLRSRDTYPTRSFQTSSVYLDNKILPPTSYWALKDIKTEEIVIDFSEIGTKISADDKGNYFSIDFKGIQPERYYQILFRVVTNNQDIIINNKSNYFKIIR